MSEQLRTKKKPKTPVERAKQIVKINDKLTDRVYALKGHPFVGRPIVGDQGVVNKHMKEVDRVLPEGRITLVAHEKGSEEYYNGHQFIDSTRHPKDADDIPTYLSSSADQDQRYGAPVRTEIGIAKGGYGLNSGAPIEAIIANEFDADGRPSAYPYNIHNGPNRVIVTGEQADSIEAKTLGAIRSDTSKIKAFDKAQQADEVTSGVEKADELIEDLF